MIHVLTFPSLTKPKSLLNALCECPTFKYWWHLRVASHEPIILECFWRLHAIQCKLDYKPLWKHATADPQRPPQLIAQQTEQPMPSQPSPHPPQDPRTQRVQPMASLQLDVSNRNKNLLESEGKTRVFANDKLTQVNVIDLCITKLFFMPTLNSFPSCLKPSMES